MLKVLSQKNCKKNTKKKKKIALAISSQTVCF